ncbi:MAG: 3-keto-disaccharide hydrolase [Planctomycetaceae bacterium]
MKFLSLALVFVSVALAGGALAPAADDAAGDGWVSLFDGKDLSKWKASEGVAWTIEDGAIATPPQRSHLFSIEEFKNFELKAECLTTPGSNSGLYFHTAYEDYFPKQGYEVQCNQSHSDPVKTGSLYFAVKLFASPVKDNEWYTYHLIVKGKSLTVKINDKTLYEFVEPEGVTGPRKFGKGSFALQGHDPKSKVLWKNIRVKRLPD